MIMDDSGWFRGQFLASALQEYWCRSMSVRIEHPTTSLREMSALKTVSLFVCGLHQNISGFLKFTFAAWVLMRQAPAGCPAIGSNRRMSQGYTTQSDISQILLERSWWAVKMCSQEHASPVSTPNTTSPPKKICSHTASPCITVCRRQLQNTVKT